MSRVLLHSLNSLYSSLHTGAVSATVIQRISLKRPASQSFFLVNFGLLSVVLNLESFWVMQGKILELVHK